MSPEAVELAQTLLDNSAPHSFFFSLARSEAIKELSKRDVKRLAETNNKLLKQQTVHVQLAVL